MMLRTNKQLSQKFKICPVVLLIAISIFRQKRKSLIWQIFDWACHVLNTLLKHNLCKILIITPLLTEDLSSQYVLHPGHHHHDHHHHDHLCTRPGQGLQGRRGRSRIGLWWPDRLLCANDEICATKMFHYFAAFLQSFCICSRRNNLISNLCVCFWFSF